MVRAFSLAQPITNLKQGETKMPDPLNVVIDISHHNGNKIDLQQAKGDGIIGVIHKATQGQTGLDPMYVTNRGKAQAAGLLWGAYHFATGGDGVAQAQHFLDVVGKHSARSRLRA
jgi:lysozyme